MNRDMLPRGQHHGGRFKALSKICYLSVSTCYYGQSYPEECG